MRQRSRVFFFASSVAALLAGGITADALGRVAASGHPAIDALDAYMAAWSSGDARRLAATMHFPFTRQSFKGWQIWQNAESYAAPEDRDPLLRPEWQIGWESLELIQTGSDKAHVAGVWRRLDEKGQGALPEQVAYIVTEENGRWGVRARFAAGPAVSGEAAAEAETAALRAADEYMAAFNARDPVAWAATLNYPHVRVASGEIRTWKSAGEYARWMDFDRFASQTGWQRSEWDSVRAVQVSALAVNVALHFTRYDANGQAIASYETLYLVTRQVGHWGVRARSSFAP